MPKIDRIFTLEITPLNFLNACSPLELKELEILLSGPFYQNRMNQEIIMQECIGCNNEFDIETMKTDSADEYYCSECAKELFPVMEREYKELVAKGEIEDL